MDLNICLYCEKQLNEDVNNFCSSVCETNEASKPVSNNQSTYYSPSQLFANARSSSTTLHNYEKPNHRRLSTSPSSLSLNHSSRTSSLSSSSASNFSTTAIHDSIKQQFVSWETPSSSHHQQKYPPNVHTNCLF